MNYINKIIILTLILSLFCACPDKDKDNIDATICIKNTTNKDIYFLYRGSISILDRAPTRDFFNY